MRTTLPLLTAPQRSQVSHKIHSFFVHPLNVNVNLCDQQEYVIKKKVNTQTEMEMTTVSQLVNSAKLSCCKSTTAASRPKLLFRNRHPSYPPCQRSSISRPLPSPGTVWRLFSLHTSTLCMWRWDVLQSISVTQIRILAFVKFWNMSLSNAPYTHWKYAASVFPLGGGSFVVPGWYPHVVCQQSESISIGN